MSFLKSSCSRVVLILATLGPIAPGPILSGTSAKDPGTILFFGDSLTAGYGLDDPAEAFPYRVENRAEAEGIPLRVIPSGLSGETTAAGLRRIAWVMRPPRDWPRDQPFRIDVLVLALGGNDGLRGIEISTTRRNLLGIIAKAREKYPDIAVVLAGIEMPVNWGEEYREAFRRVFREVAEEADADAFIPFLLKGVATDPALMQPDRIHPNAAGHRVMAGLVWDALKPLTVDKIKQPQ